MNKSINKMRINPHIFPLHIVKMAIYSIMENVNIEIEDSSPDAIILRLESIDKDLNYDQAVKLINDELITASVNEYISKTNVNIRNYFAQTAFLLKTENQEFINKELLKHSSEEISELRSESFIADDKKVENDEDCNFLIEDISVLIKINESKYLIPDVLWVANEMKNVCNCQVDAEHKGKILVRLMPKGSKRDLNLLGKSFLKKLQQFSQSKVLR